MLTLAGMEDWIDRLQKRLDALGWNQQDLAKALDMTYQGVNHWFTAKRAPDSIETYKRISAATECSTAWLLFGAGPEENIDDEDLRLVRLIRRLPPGEKSAAEMLLRAAAGEPPDNNQRTGTRG